MGDEKFERLLNYAAYTIHMDHEDVRISCIHLQLLDTFTRFNFVKFPEVNDLSALK